MALRNKPNADLTIDEVAMMHRVSRRTVERWISSGTLAKAKLPGGGVRIKKADAEALLQPVDTPQSSAAAADSTEHTHAGDVPRPSVSSGAEDVPPTSSALPNLERVAS
jgi:excisionase family DNA binding protein